MTTEHSTATKQPTHLLHYISVAIYVLAIVVSSILLVAEPDGFDARKMIGPLVAVLFVSGLGVGHFRATKASSRALMVVGIVAIAVQLAFVGFFIVVGVGWFVALTHV